MDGVTGIPKEDTVDADEVEGVREGRLYDTVPMPYVLLDVYPSNSPYALVRLVLGDRRRGIGMGIGAGAEVGPL